MNKKIQAKTYISIRIVNAIDEDDAVAKIEDGMFDESHDLSDIVVELTDELKKLLK